MNLEDLEDLKLRFQKGENITSLLRTRSNSSLNSPFAIQVAYDLQSGEYTRAMLEPEYAETRMGLMAQVASALNILRPTSLLDVGTGEGTSLHCLLKSLQCEMPLVFACDISYSRLVYCRKNISTFIKEGSLFVADIGKIPLRDSSIDVVTTCFALEPNHGREEGLLAELFRVARRAVVMMEPSWELGGSETRERIERHGYVRGIPDAVKKLGHRITRFEKVPDVYGPSYQMALMVAEKAKTDEVAFEDHQFDLVSPGGGRQLIKRNGFLLDPIGVAFPIIEGIPCLLEDQAILASALVDGNLTLPLNRPEFTWDCLV